MPKKKPNKKTHKRPFTKPLTTKVLDMATRVAAGQTQSKVAADFNTTQQNVSRACAEVNRRLPPGTTFDDVCDARKHSELRLAFYRRRLLTLAGVIDHEDPRHREHPMPPSGTADRRPTQDEWDAYFEICQREGFDGRGGLITFAEPAQQVSALRVLVSLEQRRARLWGLDAPKLVANTTAKTIGQMSDAEILQELEDMGLQPPPGLRDALARNPKLKPPAQLTPAAADIGLRPIAGTGAQPAGNAVQP